MPRALIALSFVVILFSATEAAAQGNVDAGKAAWTGGAMWCRNCHGENGEGGFGPDLAGRKLSAEQFRHAIREPWGVMPAFTPEWVSDQDIANVQAYVDSLPAVATPGKWRVPAATGGSVGVELAIAGYGCAQCHGANMAGTRLDVGAIIADFEWFKGQVYTHTTEMPVHRKVLGEENRIMRMGNFSKARLPEAALREIWNYMNELGPRAYVTSSLTSKPGTNGTEYTLVVDNGGLPGKGLVAEDATVVIALSPGYSIVNPTSAGYQGVKRDEALKADAASWKVARIGPRQAQTFTFTVTGSGEGRPVAGGQVRWMKPVSEGKPDFVAIGAPAPPRAAQ